MLFILQRDSAPSASIANGASTLKQTLGKSSNGTAGTQADKDPVSQRLGEIYKRLEQIDAYSAESRAASILAVSQIL